LLPATVTKPRVFFNPAGLKNGGEGRHFAYFFNFQFVFDRFRLFPAEMRPFSAVIWGKYGFAELFCRLS